MSDAPDDKQVLWVSMQVRGFVGREGGYVVSLFGCRKGRCMGPVAVMLSLDRRATLPCRLILLRQTNLWVTGEPQNCFASKIRYLSALNNHWKQPAHRSSDGLCPEHQPWVSHVGRRSIEYYQSSSWLSWYRGVLDVADRLAVVVRCSTGPRVRLKTVAAERQRARTKKQL